MNPEFRRLRRRQIARSLEPFLAAETARPPRGWIRAIREASGLKLREVAERIGGPPSLAAYMERSEAEYRITLGKLRQVGEALGCELVYALVPRKGSIHSLAEERAKVEARESVRAVEHTMALEDQAVGDVEAKIEEQTQRILKKQ
jgi:predicted DNA-binding mobile mystery protein A